MLNITSQMLEDYTLFKIRLTDVSTSTSSDEEVRMARAYVGIFQDELNEKGLSTQVVEDRASCGNVVHPLLRLNSLKEHGSIGLLFNKSLLIIVMLEFGKTTNLKMEKERLSSQSEYLHQKLCNWGNYSSGVGLDNIFGLRAQSRDSNTVKNIDAALQRIQYDPTDLMWDEEWERDITDLIKEVFGAN